MRRRRVKVQVRAASAALDAALATSAPLVGSDSVKATIKPAASAAESSNAGSAALDSTVEVGPRSPRKRGGRRPGHSGPLLMPGESATVVMPAESSIEMDSKLTQSPKKLFHRSSRAHPSKTHGVGTFDFDEPDVVRTSSGALVLARAVSSPTVGTVSTAAKEAVANAGARPSTTNSASTTAPVQRNRSKNRYSSSSSRSSTSSRPSTSSSSSLSTVGSRAARNSRGRSGRHRSGKGSSSMKNSSSDSSFSLDRSHRYGNTSTYARSKENMPNQDETSSGTDTETAERRVARIKKATVPRPFTFTSRRKQRSTPKHIRFQREALARRAEREANKGTRRTRFF
jgi:hypothetical protein